MAAMNETAEDRLRQAVELRRALGDTDAIAGAIAKLGAVLITIFRRDAGLALLEPAVDELIGRDRAPTGPGGVDLLAQLARAYFFHEAQARAVEVADRALEAGERLDLASIVSDVLITRGSALCHIGRSYEGIGAIRAGIELADERGLVSTALRGRLNLGVLASDPRTSFAAAEAALEVARRFGLRGFIRTLVGNFASAGLEVGEWDRAVHELVTTRDETTDELEANHMRWALLTFSAWRGDDVAPDVARMTAWVESFDESGPREALHGLHAEIDFAAGSFRTACDEWIAFGRSDALNAPSAYFGAGLAGLLAADRGRAEAALAELDAMPGNSRLRSYDRRLLRAGLAALDGRAPEALREARAVFGEYGRLGLPWREALGALMLVSTIGSSDAEVRALAESARETFLRLGARPFVALLDAQLAHPADRAGHLRRSIQPGVGDSPVEAH